MPPYTVDRALVLGQRRAVVWHGELGRLRGRDCGSLTGDHMLGVGDGLLADEGLLALGQAWQRDVLAAKVGRIALGVGQRL